LADMDEVMPIEQRQGCGAGAIHGGGEKPAAPTAVAPKTAVAKPAPKPPAAKPPAARRLRPRRPPLPTRPTVVPSGSWRIQLGAFGQRKSANPCTPSWPEARRTTGILYPGRSGGAFAGWPVRKPWSRICRLFRLAPQACFPVEAR
jgi:hypothetical protein